MKMIQKIFQRYKIAPIYRSYNIKGIKGFKNINKLYEEYYNTVNTHLIKILFTNLCYLDNATQNIDIVDKTIDNLMWILSDKYNVILEFKNSDVSSITSYLLSLIDMIIEELPSNFRDKMNIMSLPMDSIKDDLNCITNIDVCRVYNEETYILNFLVVSTK